MEDTGFHPFSISPNWVAIISQFHCLWLLFGWILGFHLDRFWTFTWIDFGLREGCEKECAAQPSAQFASRLAGVKARSTVLRNPWEGCGGESAKHCFALGRVLAPLAPENLPAPPQRIMRSPSTGCRRPVRSASRSPLAARG